jgi:hypothetical protein
VSQAECGVRSERKQKISPSLLIVTVTLDRVGGHLGIGVVLDMLVVDITVVCGNTNNPPASDIVHSQKSQDRAVFHSRIV